MSGEEKHSTAMVPEERVLLWALLVLGGIRVAIAVVARGEFGAEPTIALMMFCFGAFWGLRRSRTRPEPEQVDLDRFD